ncbi:MAG: hypothetical protein A2268_00635 [Candidatus Raymondbacteria bacterium RifOxyA12_full_50_37]|uniref:Lipocalin-like domain-containing protein n=1 Tax=Candidatus Raymondbacteria bacterium RIFOXYD12_FULL_49_13 TaxID=1817890 RepID=A0A1F7F167_UNCRA|nr:MAG: hypothetical protein A2350_20410 [Candidatus Raymondbacteria bacterium RifOxyB12_full_50_8]OGJ90663.1 MAG: hypothetical protein A2268_00635 [Candidatus Raymondbacteria bacterium RifOxyA12_full_50_37]OGJ92006.1 MAG: hypothetical protein A2248_15695 [Candidatus Raymondbacteria bacterium RIFOXYA2_FULL_49_16]OGK00399.1 MAG: hypothetical protein A2519_01190 [Candidatus Raymondbacteria bacterium RIFOXYD12_FULL_49_13]OGK04807.1 MAG: hypothetical protein A2487_11550 [Candidatus Raymondbacteria 
MLKYFLRVVFFSSIVFFISCIKDGNPIAELSESNLVGTWKSPVPDSSNRYNYRYTYTFEDDGHMQLRQDVYFNQYSTGYCSLMYSIDYNSLRNYYKTENNYLFVRYYNTGWEQYGETWYPYTLSGTTLTLNTSYGAVYAGAFATLIGTWQATGKQLDADGNEHTSHTTLIFGSDSSYTEIFNGYNAFGEVSNDTDRYDFRFTASSYQLIWSNDTTNNEYEIRDGKLYMYQVLTESQLKVDQMPMVLRKQ